MMYQVRIRKKAGKNLNRLSLEVRQLFFLLVEDLKQFGPIQKDWKNYSKLGGSRYHCHLNYSHVACWTWEKNTIEVEVYYVGSREKAPY
jgi:mRNA-degrading endonuclease RelE of RelBE toxin-antitoxin system